MPSKSDINETAQEKCSKVCTRTLFALLVVAAFAYTSSHNIRSLKDLQALTDYYSLRLKLKLAFENALADPFWTELEKKAGGKEQLKNWRLSKIQNSYESIIETAEKVNGKKGEPAPVPDRSQPLALRPVSSSGLIALGKLAPPSGARVGVTFFSGRNLFQGAIGFLRSATNGANLAEARFYSNAAALRISHWWIIVDRIRDFERRDDGTVTPRGEGAPFEFDGPNLTLFELEQLAETDLVSVEDLENEASKHVIEVPWVQQRIAAMTVIGLIVIFQCFGMLYYWMYAKHADLANKPATPGTLFGAINHDWSSRLLYTIVLFVPFFAQLELCRVDEFNDSALKISTVVIFFLTAASALCSIGYSQTRVASAIRRFEHLMKNPLSTNSDRQAPPSLGGEPPAI